MKLPVAKCLMTVTLLVALGADAQAKLAAVADLPAHAPSADDLATGAVGVTLERDYFHSAPDAHKTGRSSPCRLQPSLFDKTRLAQECH